MKGLRCDNGFSVPRAIMFRKDNFAMLWNRVIAITKNTRCRCRWNKYLRYWMPWRSVHPQTNHISTQTKCPPDKPSAVTIYYCHIPFQSGRIVCPPQIVTIWPSKFRLFVTSVTNRLTVIFYPKVSDILSAYFSSNFAVTFPPNVIKGLFSKNSAIFTHFHMWQLILKGPCTR